MKTIKNLLLILLGMVIMLSIFFFTFFFAVIQASEKNDPCIRRYGTVIEQTYEGFSDYDDYYLIQFENGDIHEIETDDLRIGDEVTVFFYKDEPIRTLYGRR